MSLAIDRAALAAAKALAARQPQANIGNLLGPIAGLATSLIPGGAAFAPLVAGAVGDLGGGGSSSGGVQQAMGPLTGGGGSSDPLFQGLNAAQAAALVQAAAKGNAAQTAGLVQNALGQVGTNTSNAQGGFAKAVAGLGGNPALASGITPATLGAAPRISGIGNTSSVGAGGVNAPGAPRAPDYASVLASLSPSTASTGPVAAPQPSAGTQTPPAGGTDVGQQQPNGSDVFVKPGEPGPDPSYTFAGGKYGFNGASNDPSESVGPYSTLDDAIAAWVAKYGSSPSTATPSTPGASPPPPPDLVSALVGGGDLAAPAGGSRGAQPRQLM